MAATTLHFLWAGIVLGLVNLMIRLVLDYFDHSTQSYTLGVFTLIINT